jgi:hypothetical protein
MKAEGFANATEMELRQKANECFDKLESRGSAERPALLIEAQFYIDEIERREQGRIASRGYRLEKIVLGLEIIVVILIGLELIDGERQFRVLDALAKSATVTATNMISLQKAQEDAVSTQKETLRTIQQVNTAMQDQLKLLSAEQKRQLSGAKVRTAQGEALATLVSEGISIRDRAAMDGTQEVVADWERWRTKVEDFLAKNLSSGDLQTFRSWNVPGEAPYSTIRNEIGALEAMAARGRGN